MVNFIEQKLKEKELNDLVTSYGNILTVLYDNDGVLSMKEIGNLIGKLIGKDKSTVTALCNKLINLGYIEKEKSTKDKRVTYIKVTQKSKNIESKFNDISQEVYLSFSEKDFISLSKSNSTRII